VGNGDGENPRAFGSERIVTARNVIPGGPKPRRGIQSRNGNHCAFAPGFPIARFARVGNDKHCQSRRAATAVRLSAGSRARRRVFAFAQPFNVMAGLVPAIHAGTRGEISGSMRGAMTLSLATITRRLGVDARHKAGHDALWWNRFLQPQPVSLNRTATVTGITAPVPLDSGSFGDASVKE
jgi:hypothetical protein